MEDGEGLQDFDFEQGLDTRPAVVTPSPVPNGTGLANVERRPYRRNFRQTVCRHWLRGLCMKGNDCGFLHQYDKSRMPVCRFFAKWGECREPDCFFKHTNEDVKECNMYKLGFCPNGPECRYRHLKLPGPAPPPEQHLPRVQHRVYQNGNYYRQRHADIQEHGSHEGNLLASQGLLQDVAVPAESGLRGDQISSVHQKTDGPRIQEEQSQPKLLGQETAATPPPQHTPVQDFASDSVPLPGGVSRYFIVKSNNIENLDLSVKRGLWATHRNNESRLNEAYDKCDNVILIFSVNETRHFQGCAKMMTKIGGAVVGAGWKYANGTAHYGRNFRIKWLKLCQLSFQKTRHLRNPYNEDLPVKISRDCQELEPAVGHQLAKLLYLEPDSELMAVAKVTESNWEEEESKSGIAGRPEVEDTKIVPFEDGESEEESSEEEDEEEDFANNNKNQMGPMGRGQWYGGRGRPLPGRGTPYGMPPQGIPPPGDTYRMGPGNPGNGFGGIIPAEEAFGGGNMMGGPGPSFSPFRPIRPGFPNGRPDFPRPDFSGPHFNGPDFPGRNFPRPDFSGNDFLPRPPPFSGAEFGTEFARPDFPGPGFPGQEFGGIPGPGGMGEVFGPRRGGGYPGMGPRVRNNMGFRGSRPMFPPGGGGPGGFMGPEGPMAGWAGGGGGGGGVPGGSNGPPFMGPGGPGLQQPFVGGERGGHGGLQGGIRPPISMGRGAGGVVPFRSAPPSGGSAGRGSAGRESPASGEDAGDSNNINNNTATTTTITNTTNNNNNTNKKTQHTTAHNSTEETERLHTSSQSLSRRRFEEEEGVSEDEAPRRSRHKRRKTWEEEEDEEEMRWDDYVEGADPWEAARQAETAGNTNGGEDNNVDY